MSPQTGSTRKILISAGVDIDGRLLVLQTGSLELNLHLVWLKQTPHCVEGATSSSRKLATYATRASMKEALVLENTVDFLVKNKLLILLLCRWTLGWHQMFPVFEMLATISFQCSAARRSSLQSTKLWFVWLQNPSLMPLSKKWWVFMGHRSHYPNTDCFKDFVKTYILSMHIFFIYFMHKQH